MKRTAILAVALLLAFSLGAGAAEEKQPTSADTSPLRATFDGPASNSPLVINQDADKGGGVLMDVDITGVGSWDLLDDPDNVLVLENLGVGGTMTGVGWDVNLSTVGASWLSEAVMYFDGQDLDGTGLFLTVGVGNGAPGAMNFNSGGILDLSDNGIADIVTGDDGMLYIQFFESFDDVADAADAFYDDSGFPVVGGAASTLTIQFIPGIFPSTIPTLSSVGLVGLVLLLAGLGVFLMRRRSLTNLS